MDHIDFSGSVFNTPVVGKSVTQVTSVREVRPDDKYYVVMVEWSDLVATENEHAYYDTTTDVAGVATIKARANDRVRSMEFEGAVMAFESVSDVTGLVTRTYHMDDEGDSTVTVYVDVVDAV